MTLKTPKTEVNRFWVTRRQWLFLLYQLGMIETLPIQELPDISAQGNQEDSVLVDEGDKDSAKKSAHQDDLDESVQPASTEHDKLTSLPIYLIKQIRVLRLKSAVRIVFVPKNQQHEGHMVLTTPNEKLANLRQLIEENARQALWDVESAIKRITSNQSAKQTNKRRQNRLH